MTGDFGKTSVLFFAIIFMVCCTFAFRGPHNALAADESATPIASSNPFSGDPGAIQQGTKLYFRWCVQCHGPKADGTSPRWGKYAQDLRKFWRGYSEFIAIVVAGRPKKKMMAFGPYLSGEEISQIGAYLETLALEGANWKDR